MEAVGPHFPGSSPSITKTRESGFISLYFIGRLTILYSPMRPARLLLCAVLLMGFAGGQTKKAEKTDAQIRQAIIAESIASYRGSCPCPYNTDRGGRRCGARSAYSRPGGASPLCYDRDVTQDMIDAYRRTH